MANLSVQFIKRSNRIGSLYGDRMVVKSLSFTVRYVKLEGFDLAYYCRKTKCQDKCWLTKSNGRWAIYHYANHSSMPSPMSYDEISVSIR